MANVLDNMTANRRFSPLSRPAAKPGKGPVLRPLVPRARAKVLLSSKYASASWESLSNEIFFRLQTQATLLQMAAGKREAEPAAEQPPRAPPPSSKAEDAEHER